MTNCL